MMDPKIASHHDIRYLRDTEIDLTTKMAIRNKRHFQEDYIKYIRKQLAEDNDLVQDYAMFVDMLNLWTEEYVVLSNYYDTIKYKVFLYGENECLVSFFDLNGRGLFSISITNELQEE